MIEGGSLAGSLRGSKFIFINFNPQRDKSENFSEKLSRLSENNYFKLAKFEFKLKGVEARAGSSLKMRGWGDYGDNFLG